MQIPLSWLKDYVNIELPIAELRRRLDLAGLEVETIEALGYPEAALPWDPEKILTAEVLAVRPHPHADRLVLAEVNYGGDEHEIVVTGAPSLFARRGEAELHLKVAFAWEGAVLYNGHSEGWEKIKLRPTKIRGVPSRAMVCSEKELGLAEEQTDIIYLDAETPVGVPLVEVLGDYILDFDIKGPFGHLQSVYGIAREIAALLDQPLKRYPLTAAERLSLTSAPDVDFIELEIAAPALCPRYTATLIRDVEIKPSPFWLQTRLQRAGVRPINNIVDITNYVMLELGEPLHAFDYALLRPREAGGKPAITVRCAAAGEEMQTLDAVTRTFDNEMLLITDGGGPVAVAGVMGGLESEVVAETTNILLEAASFNFINVRRTAQTLKLPSESSARFGKRVDTELAFSAAARAAELMAELAGGAVVAIVGDHYPGKPTPVTITYRPALAARILGVEIPVAEQQRILTALEFELAAVDSEQWRVTVPSYRLDVRRPVDLVEELGRIWGYDRFPHTLIAEELPPLRHNLELEGAERVRDILAGLGLDEVITYSLVDPTDEERLHPEQTLALSGQSVTLRNSLAPERSQMRRTLLPGLLRRTWDNLRFLERIAIFEVGRIYYQIGVPNPATGETGVTEPRRLGILLTGPRQKRWYLETDRESLDYFDLKGIAEALLRRLDLTGDITWERGEDTAYHPGRCATVSVAGQPLGVLGELHPVAREAFDLPEQPLVLLEWDLDALLAASRAAEATKKVGRVSTYPPVHQDLALVMDEAVPALEVQRAILKAGKNLVTRATLFDVYRGPQLKTGQKSLAFALTYQSADHSLSEQEIQDLRRRILKRLKYTLNVTLRAV
ncbi:MAG TPA: phenylalanine--tRNA ligase subunit beta [Thermoflexia bacterium]|nr:phenylalanine--tRNA ligase subunit beta [Thermoflexia bacterium]